jgi:hypothetical protein
MSAIITTTQQIKVTQKLAQRLQNLEKVHLRNVAWLVTQSLNNKNNQKSLLSAFGSEVYLTREFTKAIFKNVGDIAMRPFKFVFLNGSKNIYEVTTLVQSTRIDFTFKYRRIETIPGVISPLLKVTLLPDKDAKVERMGSTSFGNPLLHIPENKSLFSPLKTQYLDQDVILMIYRSLQYLFAFKHIALPDEANRLLKTQQPRFLLVKVM